MLEQSIPQATNGRKRRTRSAFIGAAASIVSAVASNALRVLKVYRQVYQVWVRHHIIYVVSYHTYVRGRV